MTSTTLIATTVLDGIIVNSHNLWKPIAKSEDLHTVIVPGDIHPHHGVHHYGLTTGLTDVTSELSSFDLKSRINTTYFRRSLLSFLNEYNIETAGIDSIIAQISNIVVSAEEASKKLGTLFTHDSDTFAKLLINDVWSLRMWRSGEGFSGLNHGRGLYGTFDMTPPSGNHHAVNGVFQLTHRDTVYGSSRFDFTSLGMIDPTGVQDLQDWLAQEFIDRWQFVMTPEMVDALHFCFDDKCQNKSKRTYMTLPSHQFHVGPEIQLDPVRIETVADRHLQQLQPGVEIQVHGTVSTIDEVVPLDEATEAGTRVLIMSKADDGETFLFLIGARQTDHNYTTGIPVANMLDVLLTV